MIADVESTETVDQGEEAQALDDFSNDLKNLVSDGKIGDGTDDLTADPEYDPQAKYKSQ